MSTSVHLDLIVNSKSSNIPKKSDMENWVTATVCQFRQEAEISLLIVDEQEGAELNRKWRNKEGPTNVLSFPANLPEELNLPLLGDLVICAPVVEREAIEQKKDLVSHWAHMVVHGTLHLLDYDHNEEEEIIQMEALETEIISGIGFPDPYQDDRC